MSTSACDPRKYSVISAATLISAIDQRLQKVSFLARFIFSPPSQAAIFSDSTEPFDGFDEISYQPVKEERFSVIEVIIRDRQQLRGTTNKRGHDREPATLDRFTTRELGSGYLCGDAEPGS